MKTAPAAPDPEDEVEQARMPLLEHLRELRDRLIKSLVAIVVFTGAGFWTVDPILAFLRAPFDQALADAGVAGGLSLIGSPFEGMYVTMHVAIATGLLASSPFVTWQAWQFIAPGLYKTERRLVLPLTLTSTALFLSGALFCYYVIFPNAFPFFVTVVDAQAMVSVDGYLSAVLRMMGAFGLSFQLPVVTFFLARLGFIDHLDMIRAFRYAIVAIFILAALITPPDVLTQTLLAIPLMALYVASIAVAWMFTTKVRAPAEPASGQVAK